MSSYVAGSIKSSGEKTSRIYQHILMSLISKSYENSLSNTKRKVLNFVSFQHLIESNSVVEAQNRKVYPVEW